MNNNGKKDKLFFGHSWEKISEMNVVSRNTLDQVGYYDLRKTALRLKDTTEAMAKDIAVLQNELMGLKQILYCIVDQAGGMICVEQKRLAGMKGNEELTVTNNQKTKHYVLQVKKLIINPKIKGLDNG